MYAFSYFYKDSNVFVTFRATFRDSFLFLFVCLSLNTIQKFNSLIKGWDRFFSGVFFQIITHMKM